MSYESVRAAVPESINIVSDPPRVLARAELDNAPFAASDELRAWVTKGLAELS